MTTLLYEPKAKPSDVAAFLDRPVAHAATNKQ